MEGVGAVDLAVDPEADPKADPKADPADDCTLAPPPAGEAAAPSGVGTLTRLKTSMEERHATLSAELARAQLELAEVSAMDLVPKEDARVRELQECPQPSPKPSPSLC